MVWITTISPEDATGELAESYAWQSARLSRPTDFTLLGSLEPPLVNARLVLYKATEGSSSALTVRQLALIGHVASVANGATHCASRTRIKLLALGFTPDELVRVEQGDDSGLDAGDAALVAYSRKLTLTPGLVEESDVQALRAAGFGDHEIVVANAQVAHLNYTNRVSHGLGLHHEEEPDFPSFNTVPL